MNDISESFAELKNTTVNILNNTNKEQLKLDSKTSFKDGIKKFHQFIFCKEIGKIQCRIRSNEGELHSQLVTENVDMEF